MYIELRRWRSAKDGCALYACVVDGSILPVEYLHQLAVLNEAAAQQLANFIDNLVREPVISPILLRDEWPPGIFAMYNHKHLRSKLGYCPARLTCVFPSSDTCKIMLVGGGVLKNADVPIQNNPELLKYAKLLDVVARHVATMIEEGSIVVRGNELIGSLSFSV